MKCRECPLSLRCLAGRLGSICYCPHCGYLTLEDIDLHTHDGHVNAVRLHCERRTSDIMKGVPPLVKGQGVIVPDPVGGFMGIAQCSKCEAQDRAKHGWKTVSIEAFTKQELD